MNLRRTVIRFPIKGWCCLRDLYHSSQKPQFRNRSAPTRHSGRECRNPGTMDGKTERGWTVTPHAHLLVYYCPTHLALVRPRRQDLTLALL